MSTSGLLMIGNGVINYLKMKKNHKTLLKVTDILIQAWIYSLMGLTILGTLSLVFGLITGEAQIPTSFGIYG